MADPAPLPDDLWVSPAMIFEIAQGTEPDHVVAARYGWKGERFDRLKATPRFKQDVAQYKARQSDPDTTKTKALIIWNDLLPDLYRAALASDSVAVKLEVMKYIGKVAGLEPNAQAIQGGNPAFHLTLNLGAQTVTVTQPQAPVVDGTAEPVKPPVVEAPQNEKPAADPGPQGDQVAQEEVKEEPAPEAPVEQAPTPFTIPDFDLAKMGTLDDVLRALDD